MEFARASDMLRQPPSELTVREIDVDHAREFANIAGEAFNLSQATRRLVEALVPRPDWHMYMSFHGDSPAGTGALFFRDGVGYLNWAATACKFSCRGGQTLVLWKRITEAIGMGCDLLTTTIGETGEDSRTSCRNVRKVGFQEAYRCTDWCLPST